MQNLEHHKSLQGKVAIVTGAGRGIGEAIALELASRGASVFVNDVQGELAGAVAQKIRDSGGIAFEESSNIATATGPDTLTQAALSRFGKIDLLVNNAGITRDGMLHKLTDTQWDEVIDVNLKAPFRLGQACARAMIAAKQGVIVNIASVSWLGNVGQSNYSASKAGLVGMTRTWALELARHNIRVNAVAPGFIQTALTDQMPQEIRERFAGRIPLKRLGKPSEIARMVSFLVGPESDYITGQVFHVDGGLSTGVQSA